MGFECALASSQAAGYIGGSGTASPSAHSDSSTRIKLAKFITLTSFFHLTQILQYVPVNEKWELFEKSC